MCGSYAGPGGGFDPQSKARQKAEYERQLALAKQKAALNKLRDQDAGGAIARRMGIDNGGGFISKLIQDKPAEKPQLGPRKTSLGKELEKERPPTKEAIERQTERIIKVTNPEKKKPAKKPVKKTTSLIAPSKTAPSMQVAQVSRGYAGAADTGYDIRGFMKRAV